MTSINLLGMVVPAQIVQPNIRYTPATGNLRLHDIATGTRGIIMQAIIANDPTNPGVNPARINQVLAQANTAIATFDGRGQNFRSYQDIMANLMQATNTQQALAAIRAFESVIMHLYDYRAYMIGHYRAGLSIFGTGIRWSLLNPTSYFSPKSWLTDNDAELHQLIEELYNLANIAMIHNSLEGSRIKATAHSYRYWRQYLAAGCLAYLAKDMYKNGFNKSIVKILSEDGLVNGCAKVGKNIISSAKQDTKLACKSSIWLVKHGWTDIVKPTGNFILYGSNGLKAQSNKNSKDNTVFNDIETKVNNLIDTLTSNSTPKQSSMKEYVTTQWFNYLKTFNTEKT